MTKNEDLKACRDAFEAHMRSLGYPVKVSLIGTQAGYFDDVVSAAWLIWQASWNARPTPTDTAMEDASTREDGILNRAYALSADISGATSSTTDGDAIEAMDALNYLTQDADSHDDEFYAAVRTVKYFINNSAQKNVTTDGDAERAYHTLTPNIECEIRGAEGDEAAEMKRLWEIIGKALQSTRKQTGE